MRGFSPRILVILICALFIAAGLSVLAADLSSNSNSVSASSSISYAKQVPLFINNNLSVGTPTHFDERLVVNSSQYSSYENANLSNVFFSDSAGNVIPSWMQSGNSNSDNNTTYWLKLNNSIPAHSTYALNMDFGTTGTITFGPNIGEAPQLSKVYGHYDDGANVFNFYDNFSGTSLKTSLWKASHSAVTSVNNGITFNDPAYITSLSQYSSPGITEAFGNMHNPLTTSSTGNDLGGVGFGANGMNGTSPVMTMGWAENDTNALGLTVYNGNGPYTYNVSNSLSTTSYHVFGTGYINNSYTTGMIDNVIVNSSSLSLGVPSTTKLNITLGFQTANFPQSNHFYWIFEANTSTTGQNLPYQVGGQQVTFSESGMPSGDLWGYTVDNLTGVLGNGGLVVGSSYSITLPNGQFNYSIYSGQSGYVPTVSGGTFTVDGAPLTINVTFVAKTYVASFIEQGLPTGTEWSASFSGDLFTSHGRMLNASLPNGTYYVKLQSAAGYLPYPTSGKVTISGSAPTTSIVEFQSPQNQSYVRSLSSINPVTGDIQSGYNISSAAIPFAGTIAVDPANGLLFTAEGTSSGNVTVMNISTGALQHNISLGIGSYPFGLYYDSHNGYLYVSQGNGNISIIDASTSSVVNVVPVPQLVYSYPFVIPSQTSSNLFVYGANSTNETNASVYTIDPNGNILGEVNLTNITPFLAPPGFAYNLAPPIYHQELIATNLTGIIVCNVTSGVEQYIAAPAGYVPISAIPYGPLGTYLVGNENGNSNKTFNVSSLSWGNGPDIKDLALSSTFDSITGTYFISSYSLSTGVGNISAVDASNGTVLATAPSLYPSISMAFSPSVQRIYVLDIQAFFSPGMIHEYAVMPEYTVTVNEKGLPSGASWYMNITGQATSGAISAGSAYSIILGNGTYSYTFGTSDNLFHGGTGTFTVAGSTVVNLTFLASTYKVDFNETGLSGTFSWTVTVNGVNYTGTGSSIAVQLQNGSYSYEIQNINGYKVTNQTGDFNVSGAPVTLHAKFTRSQSLLSGNTIYYIIGGVAAVVAIAGFLIFWMRKPGH